MAYVSISEKITAFSRLGRNGQFASFSVNNPNIKGYLEFIHRYGILLKRKNIVSLVRTITHTHVLCMFFVTPLYTKTYKHD